MESPPQKMVHVVLSGGIASDILAIYTDNDKYHIVIKPYSTAKVIDVCANITEAQISLRNNTTLAYIHTVSVTRAKCQSI